jgi:ABC-2 type transport system ATP-binding protein
MPDSTSPPIVETAHLTKVFSDFWGRPKVTALQDLSLIVRPGEVFGLLGPNGSGKTTTIKLLLGLLYPTRGQAMILGCPPRDVRVKARIGYLPEESYLYPFLNAEETLDFYGRLFHLAPADRRRRAESLLELVGLHVEKGRAIREYSKGMARRIGIAQALINDPDLIILDEPTSGLDPIGSREVKDLILRLKQRGKTILLCSHLLADVEEVCDRIAILYGGRLRRIGSVQELLTQAQVTRIAVEGLSEETTTRILSLIRSEEGGKPVHIDHPTTRLETFFLSVVQEAQETLAATSGARMGQPQTDNFLTTGTQDPSLRREDPISKLIERTPKEPAATLPPPASVPAPPPATEIIRKLAKPSDTSGPTEDHPLPPDPAAPTPTSTPQRNVLDRLTRPASEHPSPTHPPEGKTS